MKRLTTALAAGLLLCGPALAQESDAQSGNSFSDIQAADPGTGGEGGVDDTSDANSFADSAQDNNSFSDASDANSFGSDDDSANSFSGSGDAGGAEPWQLYAGLDHVWTQASLSKPEFIDSFGGDRLDSSMYRLRAGMRVFEHIGLEAQIGVGRDGVGDLAADEFSTGQFYAVYLAPTGVIFDVLEVAATIGYARTELERPGVSESLGGASFGVNLELPLFTGEALELRIGAGGAVFRAQNSARIHGYHAGLRIDFRI